MAESDQPRFEAARDYEQQLAELAIQLGFIETEDLANLRTQIAERAASGETEEAIQAYQDEAQSLVAMLEGREYTAAQIGLVIAIATLCKSIGRDDAFAQEIKNALIMADNQGFEAEAQVLKGLLQDVSPESNGSSEPTVEELIEAASECLSEDDRLFMTEMPFEEALGYVYGALLENGVEDPESYLQGKGILE